MRPSHQAVALRLALLIGLPLLLWAAGCKGFRSTPSLQGYANASLVAGGGLGDLELDATTLQPFLRKHPGGRLNVQLADDMIGIEVQFAAERMAFLFEARDACAHNLKPLGRTLVRELSDPQAFFARHPACAGMALRSISVAAGRSLASTFYRGTSDRGVGLFTRRDQLRSACGPGEPVRGLWVAGSGASDAKLEDHAYQRGIIYFVGEATKGELKGRLVVTKMTVFSTKVAK